jgi:MOSC domain-containing protein YiiM
LGDPKFVKRFVQAARPGYYARVLAEGLLQPGPAQWEPSHHLTGVEMFHMLLGKTDESQLRRALDAPIGERFREAFASKL